MYDEMFDFAHFAHMTDEFNQSLKRENEIIDKIRWNDIKENDQCKII